VESGIARFLLCDTNKTEPTIVHLHLQPPPDDRFNEREANE